MHRKYKYVFMESTDVEMIPKWINNEVNAFVHPSNWGMKNWQTVALDKNASWNVYRSNVNDKRKKKTKTEVENFVLMTLTHLVVDVVQFKKKMCLCFTCREYVDLKRRRRKKTRKMLTRWNKMWIKLLSSVLMAKVK